MGNLISLLSLFAISAIISFFNVVLKNICHIIKFIYYYSLSHVFLYHRKSMCYLFFLTTSSYLLQSIIFCFQFTSPFPRCVFLLFLIFAHPNINILILQILINFQFIQFILEFSIFIFKTLNFLIFF